MKEEEIIAAFIPHMIETAGCGYAGIAKAIQADNFEWDGKNLTIYAAGEFTAGLLNKQMRKPFQLLLKQTFGIDADITFKNNEEMFHMSSQKFREVEEEDIRRSLVEFT